MLKLSPQCQQVVDHVDRWGSINSLEAIRHYGITRLSARIYDLRDSLLAMKSVWAETSTGFVEYRPDWKTRRASLKRQQLEEFINAPDKEIAQINVKYAAKFQALDMKEREHVRA